MMISCVLNRGNLGYAVPCIRVRMVVQMKDAPAVLAHRLGAVPQISISRKQHEDYIRLVLLVSPNAGYARLGNVMYDVRC